MGPVFWPQLALIVFIPSLIILSFLTFLFFIYKYKKFRNFDEIKDEEERVPIHDTSACNMYKPIRTIELIAKGRFSTVWKAKIENTDSKNEGEWVAVKVFSSQEKDLALFEQEVFQLPQMKNENISNFLGCFAHYDESGNEISSFNPEYWLVTEYHELGSLYDYLKANTVSYSEMLKICEGIAKGLTHLHEEIPATKTEGSKPAIAHRDFKSRNVLLKSDLTPLITDFGLCLIFYPDRIPNGLGQVGTRRYMAPEVLEGAINFSRDSLIRIDIYALALVIWEVLYRCREKDKSIEAEEYILPFQKEVGHYPTIEDMQEVVCQQKKRPEIKEAWRNNLGMNQIAETIEECWDQDADARLSASCVVERLSSLIKLKNMVII
jgi:PREDICTED: similar to activin receptor IIA